MKRRRPYPEYPCDFEKACNALYYVKELHWSQAKTARVLNTHTSTVNRILSGARFKGAVPKAPKPEPAATR